MSRPASHNFRPWVEPDHEAETFSVTSETQFFLQLWRQGHDFYRLRRDILPGMLTPPVNAMKRLQVLEHFERLVKREEERAA